MTGLRLLGRLLRETLLPRSDAGPPRSLRGRVAVLAFVPPFLALQLAHWVGFLLDELLFRAYREVEVREPLFVVGMPRSGTTFLHRVLAADEERFTTLRLWELVLAPSITERRLWGGLAALDRVAGRPLERTWRAVERQAVRFMDDVHPVRLDAPEEDYLFLLPAFACFLLVVVFPYHPAVWEVARLDDLEPPARRRLASFYRRCVQRHLYVVGPDRRLLSKNPSFTPAVATLLETFPDARVVCCVRDPVDAVPSLLSSLSEGVGTFGHDVADPALRDRFVDMLVAQTDHAWDVLSPMPPSRHAFLPLERLKADAGRAVRALYERFGWTPSPAYARRLDAERARGRAYRSRHRYGLEDTGLDAADLRRRFARLLQRVDFGGGEPLDSGVPPTGPSVDPQPEVQPTP